MRNLLFVVLLLSALAAVSCGDSKDDTCTADSATATTAVTLKNTAFDPSCIKVAVNTQVSFTNQDSMDHTVTTDSGQPETFDSGTLGPGAQPFNHTFATAGTIKIHCNIHSSMTATVIVQ